MNMMNSPKKYSIFVKNYITVVIKFHILRIKVCYHKIVTTC